jgi:hypothetical protein
MNMKAIIINPQSNNYWKLQMQQWILCKKSKIKNKLAKKEKEKCNNNEL